MAPRRPEANSIIPFVQPYLSFISRRDHRRHCIQLLNWFCSAKAKSKAVRRLIPTSPANTNLKNQARKNRFDALVCKPKYDQALQHFEANRSWFLGFVRQLQFDFTSAVVEGYGSLDKHSPHHFELRRWVKKIREETGRRLKSMHVHLEQVQKAETKLREGHTSLQKILRPEILDQFKSKQFKAHESESEVSTQLAELLFKIDVMGNKWNPLHCVFPYQDFNCIVRGLRGKSQLNRTQGLNVPRLKKTDIKKFRYLEYIHELEDTDNRQFLLSLITAYGIDAKYYPAHVFQMLFDRNLLKGLSNPGAETKNRSSDSSDIEFITILD